jgi:hypothetical protein
MVHTCVIDIGSARPVWTPNPGDPGVLLDELELDELELLEHCRPSRTADFNCSQINISKNTIVLKLIR